jgi:acyl-CoA thioester hydrolase
VIGQNDGRMAKPFRYYLRVRYVECDAQKVVYHSRYAEYVDAAFTEFIRAIGWADQLFTGVLDTQLVKQTVEWQASAGFDQVLELSVAPCHLGNTSFAIRTEFRLAGAEAILATAETVYVLVDGQAFRKVPMPDAFRAALQEGGRGRSMDHAGLHG